MRIAPDKIRTRRDKRDRHRNLLIQITDKHCRLSRSGAGHQSVDGDFGDKIVRLINREPAHVAFALIRELCHDPQLQFVRRFNQDALR